MAYKSKWGIVGTRDYRVKLFLISCVEAIREGDGKKNSQEEGKGPGYTEAGGERTLSVIIINSGVQYAIYIYLQCSNTILN